MADFCYETIETYRNLIFVFAKAPSHMLLIPTSLLLSVMIFNLPRGNLTDQS